MQAIRNWWRTRVRGNRVSLALAGGGCKAFFGLGVGQALLRAGLPIRKISGTSAGAAMAMSLLSGYSDEVVNYFHAITLRNRANFYFSRLLAGKRPFPHERMYRSAISAYTDLETILRSPIELAVNALRVPEHYYARGRRYLRYRLVSRILREYRREMRFAAQGIYRPFMTWAAQAAGLEEIVFEKKDLATPKHIEDVILAASSVPPLLRFQHLDDGYYYLDGGISNNLPISSLPREDLILAVYYDEWHMARRFYEQSGDEVGRRILYVHPEGRLPIDTWDYANAEGVRATYELGQRAAERVLPQIERMLR